VQVQLFISAYSWLLTLHVRSDVSSAEQTLCWANFALANTVRFGKLIIQDQACQACHAATVECNDSFTHRFSILDVLPACSTCYSLLHSTPFMGLLNTAAVHTIKIVGFGITNDGHGGYRAGTAF
jgi:hypothetical protein